MIRKSNEQTLKEAIESLLKTYRLQDGITSNKIIKAWEGITGDFITKRTENIFIKNKTLFVKLNSPALKNELSFAKTRLIEKLNGAVHQDYLKDIVFL